MSRSSHRSCHCANRLLSALLPDDFAILEPHLQRVDLQRGMVIYEAGDRMPFIYFPHDAIVSLVIVLADGKTIEMAKLGGTQRFKEVRFRDCPVSRFIARTICAPSDPKYVPRHSERARDLISRRVSEAAHEDLAADCSKSGASRSHEPWSG
ncbi:Crp/Fnr family transcriptional regulator [Microvirga sp. VF16]|uniref:Crp/Fnr family transcriptional regulator n=1 Tax=Microvirga sp. VF16 TaxID=2807101 RepID=UPI00193CA220|nr:Crp/Fnr family transcriptional regulator [Microvirga sp. VF16]QRM32652.1 Crp/Fnr family transcriptional regulator [Microvirga sp. VF16]